ncbi:unnamed protein product [Amaranthus hypochondriacus]
MEFGKRRENVNADGYGFFVHENGNGKGKGKGNYNGNGLINSKNEFEDDGPFLESSSSTLFAVSSSLSATTLSASSSSSTSCSPSRFIEHHVTKMDTLAGIAIRYGVEVADIKKLNGLVTDLQMFALKTLHIPLPGRHPPSTCVLNGYSSSGYHTSLPFKWIFFFKLKYLLPSLWFNFYLLYMVNYSFLL